MSDEFHHRSAFAEKKNKPFKGSSKRKSDRLNRGKTEAVASGPVRNVKNLGKGDGDGRQMRRLQASQRKEKHRSELLERRRNASGSQHGPPKLVGLVSLGPHVNLRAARTLLLQGCGVEGSEQTEGPVTATLNVGKRAVRVTFLETTRDQVDVLDLAKCADLLLMVMTPNIDKTDVGLDAHGDHLLTIIKSQGVPAVLGAVQALNSVQPKHQSFIKKQCTRYLHTQFPHEPKMLALDTSADAQQVLRYIDSESIPELRWRDQRAYMLVENADFVPTDQEKGTLKLSGYLRGTKALTANHLIHLTGFADFQLDGIEQRMSAAAAAAKLGGRIKGDDALAAAASLPMQVVSRPTGDRESLECLLPLDTHALTNEQSIITDEELRDAAGPAAIKSSKVSFAGTAAQKPSWIARPAPSVDDEEMDDGSDDASDDGSEDESQDGSDDESEEHGDIDGDDHDFGADDEDMTDEQQQEERTRLSKLRRLERDEMEFPDEVETPLDMPARERFARYRGLENFRTSPWDIYESLPVEYGRVAQFEDFEATAKAVLAGEDSLTRAAYFFGLNGVGDEMQTDPLEPGTSAYFAALQAKATELGQPNLAAGFALPGSYVTLHVANVSTAVAQRVAENAKRGAPLLASGLFAFEHKVTVMQYRLRRHPEYQDPIKGKEQMVFHVGMRRFPARPIYSDDAKHNGKHMCEKFLQLGRFAAASIYAPVSFPPAPVLAFKPTEDGRAHPLPLMMDSGTLVATGTTLHADPFRLNIKRIILTGYPMRVHKRHAVVRYMFFSAEDTKWFMPVKLRTKFGLIGQIRETLGTKGHFKCAFNDFIKQNDTICMHLYKRQFPKWVPEYWE